ncbi:MAG: WXG100 family type VII secretion target [Actinomycetes bacterium]
MTAGAGFQVDPVRLRGAAPRFDAVADQMEDARSTVETALAAEGTCWGEDDAGQTFARSYLPQAGGTAQALGTVVEALRAIRSSLDAAAGTWEGCDQGVAGRFGGGGGGHR